MPTVLEEFARETIDKLLKELPTEKLKELPIEKRFQLLETLSPEQRVQGLSAAQLRELADKKENGASEVPSR